MKNLINPALDLAAIRLEFQTRGLVQIPDFLEASVAEALFQCLDKQVAWDLAYSQGGKGQLIKAAALRQMNNQQVRETIAPAFDLAENRFQFIYNTFKVVDSFLAKEYEDHFLYRLLAAFHDSAYLQLMRQLTGIASIQRMDAFAGRYLPGHFLSAHDDALEAEGREASYVLNMSKNWLPEWGGLLHMLDDDQQSIGKTFVPAYNSMILFRPPRWHFVSQVSNYARLPRYTLTGWMLNS